MTRKTTDYIYTYSGQAIYPPEVEANQIKLIDIAYGLAGINRYNGQTRISVLRHSIALAAWQPSDDYKLYALMHDAAEAYMMDVPVPQRPFMSEEWRTNYEKFESIIYKKYRVFEGFANEDSADSMVHCVGLMDKQLVSFEMSTREIYETGSRIKYPGALIMDRATTNFLHGAYRWDLTNDQLIPLYLRQVRQLCANQHD